MAQSPTASGAKDYLHRRNIDERVEQHDLGGGACRAVDSGVPQKLVSASKLAEDDSVQDEVDECDDEDPEVVQVELEGLVGGVRADPTCA